MNQGPRRRSVVLERVPGSTPRMDMFLRRGEEERRRWRAGLVMERQRNALEMDTEGTHIIIIWQSFQAAYRRSPPDHTGSSWVVLQVPFAMASVPVPSGWNVLHVGSLNALLLNGADELHAKKIVLEKRASSSKQSTALRMHALV
jgi:hypothetical protein